MKPTPRVARMRRNERLRVAWRLLPAVVVHLYVVFSIVAQPLNVNRCPPSARSAIWALHNDTVHRIGPAADFFAVYHAGTVLARGGDPYAYDLGERATVYFYPFRYLPVVGQALGVPLQAFSPRTAYRVWIAAMECLLATLVVCFFRRFSSNAWRYFAAYALLLSSPYFLEVHMGQFTFVALSLLAIAVLLIERPARARGIKETAVGAACYVCAVALKVLPIVAVPVFARRRRYIWPVVLSVAIVLLVSVPYFVEHPNQWERFSELNLSKSPEGLGCGNFGFVYFAYLLATESSGRDLKASWPDVSTILQLVVLGATALVVLLTRHPSVELALGALVAGHMLSYTDVWEHHYSGVLVIALLALLAMTRANAAGTNRGPIGFTAAAVVLMAIPTPFVLFDDGDPRVWDPSVSWPVYQRFLVPLPKVLGALLLYAGCIWPLASGFKRRIVTDTGAARP